MTHEELGQAVALSGLADEMGTTVEGVAQFADRLAGVGLPAVLPHGVLRLAHKINRDSIDAMLWRCNRSLGQQAPTYTRAEARQHVEAVQADAARREVEEREAAARRDGRRAKANPTIKDIQADAARRAAEESAPDVEEV